MVILYYRCLVTGLETAISSLPNDHERMDTERAATMKPLSRLHLEGVMPSKMRLLTVHRKRVTAMRNAHANVRNLFKGSLYIFYCKVKGESNSSLINSQMQKSKVGISDHLIFVFLIF